jgi:phage terminase small subunit
MVLFTIPRLLSPEAVEAAHRKASNRGSTKHKDLNLERKITWKQIAFCRELLREYPKNPTNAAIRAGYPARSAKKMAYKLLADPLIRMYQAGLYVEFLHDRPLPPDHRGSKLNDRQWAFISEMTRMGPDGYYLIPSAQEAAIRAGYSPATAKAKAYELQQVPWVNYYLELALGRRLTFRELRDRSIKRANSVADRLRELAVSRSHTHPS